VVGVAVRHHDSGPLTAVAWEPDPGDLFGVQATAEGAPLLTLDFGDGTDPVTVPESEPALHVYAATGTYTITASAPGHAPVKTTVVIKDHTPVVHVFVDADDDWRTLLWVDEPGDGTEYVIDWGDGSQPHLIDRDPPPYPRVPHAYTAAGIYPVTVTDSATKRATETVFEAGQMGAWFSFPTDDAIPAVVVTRMKAGAGWELDWGDGTSVVSGVVPATARLQQTHDTVMAEGVHTVTVNEVVDGVVRRSLVRELVIPSIFSLQMNVAMSWRVADDPRTVTVTPTDTPADQTCTVDWGDGTPVEQVAGQATISHTYASIPVDGFLVTVDEDAGQLRRFHRLIGEPARVGQPQVSAWSRWSIAILIEGMPGLSNADWYGIDWGDGHNQLLAAAGAHSNTWHQYSAAGDYVLRIDGPGMAVPVTREIRVPTYPQPVLAAVEDPGDDTGMTVLVTVDNTECGGDVALDFGDGTVVAAGPEETVSHQYAQAGAYTVLAVCVADATARGRAAVVVPFGDGTTLAAVIGHEPDADANTARVTVTDWQVGNPIDIDWDDGFDDTITPPTPVTHRFDFEGDYTPVVAYTDETEMVSLPVTIPFPEE
jgi:urease gamma subunit